MGSKPLAMVTVMLLTVMIAISGGVSSFTTSNTTAQMTGNMTSDMMRQGGMIGQGMGMMDGRMMGTGPGMMIGNQSTTMQMMGAGQNITGSINLFSTISNAIASQVKVSLSQAASTAEGAVGNNSHAIAAHIGEANGYLTYCVWVLGPDMNMNMVIIDPGNGQVLSNRQVQHPMMAGKDFGMGMMAPGMMGMGPGMMAPGMMGMGPGMMAPGMMGMGPGIEW